VVLSISLSQTASNNNDT